MEITKFHLERIRRFSDSKHVETVVHIRGADERGRSQDDGDRQQWFTLEQNTVEEVVKTLDCVRTVQCLHTTAQQYCKHQRLKLGIARLRGANGTWSSEDNVKVMEVVNSCK